MAPPAGPLAIVDPTALAALKALAVTIPNAAGDGVVLLFFVDGEGRIGLGPGPSANATTPDASAALDLQSQTRGLLIPRLSTAQRNAIPAPATSLLIYNTTTGLVEIWSGSAWVPLGGVTGNGWLTNGNALGAPGLLGSLNADDVHGITNGVRRWTVRATGEYGIGSADPTAGRPFEVQLAGTPQLYMIATGEVGIGGTPTTPSELLRVERSQAVPAAAVVANPNAGAAATAGVRLLADARGYEIATTSSGSVVPSSLVLTDMTAGAPRMTVTPIGDVGIGPAAPTPGNLLEVRGDLTAENVEILGQSSDLFAIDTATIYGLLSTNVQSDNAVQVNAGTALSLSGQDITVDANARIFFFSSGSLQSQAVPIHAGDTLTGQTVGNLDAAHSVDVSLWIEADQRTAGQTGTLPVPANNDKTTDATVINIGTEALTLYGVSIAPGRRCTYTWSPGWGNWTPPA